MRFRSGVSLARVLFAPCIIAAAVAGCSGDSLKGLGAKDAKTETKPAADQNVDCPTILVRNGASTWRTPPGGSTTDLRYQASLGQMARECAVLGDTMTIKVGVEGRLLTGPKGSPGTVEVPLRLALVKEGPQPKSIWTKFYAVPVNVQPGTSGSPFTHVEDDLTFPMPSDKNLTAYVIYVGFDPQGLNARQKKKHTPVHHRAAPKAKAKPKAPPRTAPPPASNGGGFAPPASGGFAPPASGGFSPPASGGGGSGFAPPPGQFSPPAQQ
jgi:hypothetical protein